MKTLGLTILGILGIASMALVAHADDDSALMTVNYVGNRCVERSDTTNGYYWGLSIENESASTITVYCPVDNYHSIAMLNQTDLVTHHANSQHQWSVVVDDNTAGDITCNLRVCERDDSSCDSSSTDTTSGSGIETLSGSASTVGSDNNIIAIKCTLPAKSGNDRAQVTSYSVTTY